jgi:hypothetical protein
VLFLLYTTLLIKKKKNISNLFLKNKNLLKKVLPCALLGGLVQ